MSAPRPPARPLSLPPSGRGERRCPCGSGEAFGACCRPLLRGSQLAATAEALMRARYCAHATHELAFLSTSWHPDTRPPDAEAVNPDMAWLGLEIESVDGGGPADHVGTVTFAAGFVLRGQAGVHRERSEFVRLDGRWVYVDGTMLGG